MAVQRVYLGTSVPEYPFATTLEPFPVSLAKALFGARDNKTCWWMCEDMFPLDIWLDRQFRAVCDRFSVDWDKEAFDPGTYIPRYVPELDEWCTGSVEPSDQTFVFVVVADGDRLSCSRVVRK